MGHNNYSKYSNQQNRNNTNNETVSHVHIYEAPIVENQVVEENSIATEVVEPKIGITTVRLNVRKEPSVDSELLLVLEKDSEVKIIDLNNKPENDFYKVVTSEGIEGYCMKKFIKIN